ncbi:MAG: hypothetical protein R3E84_23540 [Pseudomonadales bacterium]
MPPITLNPLALDETRTYIEHRLAKVGWNDFPRFTDSAFEAIFEFCDGVPRRINNLRTGYCCLRFSSLST